MIKKALLLFGAVGLVVSSVFGEYTEDFSSYESMDDVPDEWRMRGQEQEIVKLNDNSALRVFNVLDEDRGSNIKLATGLKTRNLKVVFDWKTTGPRVGGYLFRLSDWNHNKFVYNVSLSPKGILATTFTKKGKKKVKKLFSPKGKTWYRFEIESQEDNLSYTIKATERNEDNTADVEVAYDSVETKLKLGIHKRNPPKVLFFSIWPNTKGSYFYDNIKIVEK